MFNPLEKLNELKKKCGKIIICECDGFTGLLIHKQLFELFGKDCCKTIHELQGLQDLNYGELVELAMKDPHFIITVCWDKKLTKVLFEDEENVRIYSFSERIL